MIVNNIFFIIVGILYFQDDEGRRRCVPAKVLISSTSKL